MPSPIPLSTPFLLPVATTAPPEPTSMPALTPTSEPSAHHFDDVSPQALLTSLFPDLKFAPNGDAFVVNGNPDWLMWINSRAEGQFTQALVPELAAIVAHEAPHLSDADRQRTAPWGSFLAIFQRRGARLEAVQRSFLFPTEISPSTFDVEIDRAVDFDRDDMNELLVTTTATRMGIASTAAFIYQWNDQAFVEIWSAAVGEDNTAAINQAQYYAFSSEFQFRDLTGDGMDEIIVTTTRVDYPHDDQGMADVDHASGQRVERRVFKWGGAAFVPDIALSSAP